MNELESFLYPHSRYYGQVKPENMLFNANLQEFSQRISFITSLETGGKLSPEAAYAQVKGLWKQLKRSRKQLKLNIEPLEDYE